MESTDGRLLCTNYFWIWDLGGPVNTHGIILFCTRFSHFINRGQKPCWLHYKNIFCWKYWLQMGSFIGKNTSRSNIFSQVGINSSKCKKIFECNRFVLWSHEVATLCLFWGEGKSSFFDSFDIILDSACINCNPRSVLLPCVTVWQTVLTFHRQHKVGFLSQACLGHTHLSASSGAQYLRRQRGIENKQTQVGGIFSDDHPGIWPISMVVSGDVYLFPCGWRKKYNKYFAFLVSSCLTKQQ